MSSIFEREGWKYVRDLQLPYGVTAACYVKGELRALVSRDPEVQKTRWHLSVSCADRYPTWEEIKAARYALIPDEVYMAQILPPKHEYVNVHPNTFHLHEID